jgi:serine/threonine protein kinase
MTHDLGAFAGTDRYVPVRLLGAGGMGAVYEVEDRKTGARVALKVMTADDAGRLLRFKQEFRVMAELHHPNLVRLFDLGQHEGRWFFTMELVAGHDLLDFLLDDERRATGATTILAPRGDESGEEARATIVAEPQRVACDPEALVHVVAQILDALEYLHGQGIVHRDLKPANILVDGDGVVRVLDFGLASRLDRAVAISQDGALVGTLAYLSPEQYQGERASPASDLYALGAMMFHLLTGDLPFRGAPMEALTARVERPPPRVDERVLGAPPELVAIVHRLMARDPAERPTLAALRAALGIASPASEARASSTTTGEIFVGRQRELALLSGSMERAASGETEIALVSGPSGIGKSALASMLVRRATRAGFLGFAGRCYEREQVPFIAFDRVIDAMSLTLRSWPAAELAEITPLLVHLERIFPALGILTRRAARAERRDEHADPRELYQQAFDAFVALCAAWQEKAPLCLVLDDLQWADDESIALLEHLLARRPGRVLILALLRSDKLPAEHPLERLRRALAGAPHVTELPLGPLPPADSLNLVEAVTGRRLDRATSAALAGQAEGNPFLARRLAEHVATLDPEKQAAQLDMPRSADDLLRTMIRALSPRAEHVLALAATAGGDVAPDLLRETAGLSVEELDLATSELLSSRFLKAVPRAGVEPHLDVYQDRIREVAYRGLADERRRELHRALATALEARPDPRRDAEALVRHWTGAGDLAKRRRYALEAAEQAAGKFAFARAARLLRVVLDDPDPSEDPLVIAARWERAGDLYEYGGLHLEAARAYQEAVRRWDAAPAHHPERANARLRLRGLAGVNFLATEHAREGRAAFAEGLALMGLPLERPAPERLATLATLAGRRALLERAPAIGALASRGARLSATEVRFLDLLVRAFQPLWPWPAAEAALRAEIASHGLDDKTVLQRSLAFGAVVPLFLGESSPARLERAHLRLDAADELARTHDLLLGRELVLLNRAILWLVTNKARARRACEMALEGIRRRGMIDSFDGAVARTYYLIILAAKGDADDTLAAAAREIEDPRASLVNLALALSARVRMLTPRGPSRDAAEAVDRLRDLLAHVPGSRLHAPLAVARAQVLISEGRFAEVLDTAERTEAEARAAGAWTLAIDRSLWIVQELEAAIGLSQTRELPSRARKRVREHASWIVENGIFGSSCLGHRALAYLERAEGRRAASITALRRALSASSNDASPYARWLCLEAARDLGALTLDQEAEVAELAAAERFVRPGS